MAEATETIDFVMGHFGDFIKDAEGDAEFSRKLLEEVIERMNRDLSYYEIQGMLGLD